ncbi:MAG: tandem-95 repeat protein [Chitinispirillaceae bacterium]|nr:tandem-95 repeat protein [Chitinispirillaceae bacterium]
MKKVILIITALISLFLLICELPPDPVKDPNNATATIVKINGEIPDDPISVTANTDVSIEYELHLSHFIDSFTIEILSSEKYVEARYVFEPPWNEDTYATTIVFPSAGTKTCVMTAYKEGTAPREDKLVFDVGYPTGNQPPKWSPDTVELYSKKGETITRNLRIYANDPDGNPIWFSITPSGSNQFTWQDSLLTSVAALDAGIYYVNIVVSDGILKDTGTVVWQVIELPSEHAEVQSDTAVTITDSAITIDVLANDRIASGDLLLTSVTQASNGQVVIRNNKAIYSPVSGFYGIDAFKYLVNEQDTGRVTVFVNENISGNSPPYWMPKVIPFYSIKGTPTVNNLAINAYDPDEDEVSCKILVTDNEHLSLKGFSLKSDAEIDVGVYTLTVELSDGALTDTATVIWKVIAPPTVHATLITDTAEIPQNTPDTIDVLGNDHIASDQLLLTSVLQPVHGITFVDEQKVVYIPLKDFTGNDSCRYVVNGMDTGWVIITVTEAERTNTPPEWSPDTVYYSSEKGKTETFTLADQAIDADSDPLTFTVRLPQDAAFSFNQTAGTITTDGSPDTGIYLIGVTVSDGKADGAGYVRWRIYTVPDVRAELHDDTVTVAAGIPYTIDVLANDRISSGSLTLTDAINGSHGSAAVQGTNIVYTPDDGFYGSDEAGYVVNGRDTGRIIITITRPQVELGLDSLTVSEGGSGTMNVLRNDAVSAGTLAVAEVINGTKGTAVRSDDSSIIYTAGGTQTGADTVKYVVNTGDTGYVAITISAMQFFIRDDSASVLQGRERTIRVLDNDSVSSGTLVINKATEGSLGTVAIAEDAIVYTANDDADGKDSIMYYVNNNRDSAVVRITVLSIEITTGPDSATIDEDGDPATVDVLENDAITDGTMTVTGVSLADLGTATVNDDNTVVFTPFPDSNGVDTLEYLVNDAKAELLVITITPVNDEPSFTFVDNDTVMSIDENERDTLRFRARDADKTPVTLSLVDDPAWATAVGGTDSISVIVAPGYGVAGATNNPTATFTVLGVSGEDTIRQTVAVTVNNVNTAPAFTNPTATIEVNEGASKTTVFKATDAEGDALTFDTANVPPWITVTKTDSIRLVAAPGYNVAPYESGIELSVSDGTETASHTVTVRVGQAYLLDVTRSPAAGGTVTKVKDTAAYISGTSVTLTATPSNGYRFNGWSGDTTASGNVLTIVMKKNRAVTANFKRQYTLTVTPSPSGGGTITPAAATTVDSNATTTITATPASGYKFKTWSSTASGVTFGSATSASTTVRLTSGNTTVQGEFVGLTFSKTYAFPSDATPTFMGGVQINDGGYFIAVNATPAGGTSEYAAGMRLNPSGDTIVTKIYGMSTNVRSLRKTSSGYIMAGDNGDNVGMLLINQNGNYYNAGIYGKTDVPEYGYFAQQTSDGGYITGGYNQGSSGSDYYLVKTNASRDTTWTRTFDQSGSFDPAHDCIQTSDGGYIMVGNRSMGAGGWVVKTNSAGVKTWDSTYANFFDQFTSVGYKGDFWSVQQTSDGGFIMGGKGGTTGIMVKTNSNGVLSWPIRIYSDVSCVNMVRQTSDGGYVFVGDTYTAPELGGCDICLGKTNSSGILSWIRYFGTASGDESGKSVEITSDGGFLIVSNRSGQGWVIKTDEQGLVE